MGDPVLKALKLFLTFSLALGSQALQQSAQRSQSLAQSEHSSSHVFHNKERTEKLDDDRQKTQLFARVAQDTHADKLFPEGSCRHKKQGGLNADFLLYGYNSLKGCPLVSGRDPGFTLPIFSADYSTSHVTPDGEVLVPRELLLSPDVSCVTSFTSKTVETPYDLTKLLTATATLGDDGGWGPPFSASQDFRQFSEDLRKHVLVVSRATCSLYHVTHLLQKPLPLHPMFVDWVLRLNNTDDEDAYLQFIDTYGTHFVSRARSGASFTLVHKMEDEVYRQHTEGHVTAAASYSSAALLGQYETLTSDHKRAADDFRNQVETMTVAVGAPPPSDGDSLRWLTAADNHPVTISYELSSLDVLFSKPFMGEGSALERYAIDHVGMKNMVLATKQKYCKYLKTKELVGDCEHLTPGLSLLHTRLMGHSDYTPAASADLCVEKCHQLPDCVAVTVCSGCDTNDIGHNDCRVFRFGNIHSAVTDPQWQTTILVNKLKTLLKVQNTTAVVDPRSESSPALTVTSARDCLTSCVQDASCVGFTLSDTSGRISKCTRLTDLPVSLKQEAGATVYFLSQSSKGFVTRGQTGHLAPSSIPNDWYKASCVIDDECRQENAVCFMDRCVCSPGFYLSTRDYTCSATCSPPDLQSIFTEYPDSGLTPHYILIQDNLTLQQCNDLCINTRSCLTFDFRASGGRCLLHDVTSREAESGWYPHISNGWTHYQRHCLPSPASYPGPVWYKAPCNNSMQCPDPHSQCVSGTCLCSSGSGFLLYDTNDTRRAAESCRDRQKTAGKSGVYFIPLTDNSQVQKVWCDMDSAGGGWLVFQRRRDGSIDFYRKWTEYEKGFGDVTGEFWLGLSALHTMTRGSRYKLRVDLGDVDGHRHYAEYSTFRVDGPETNYRLTVSGYSGDAGDSMEFHNNQSFTTFDRDNDKRSAGNCAADFHGAWWYSSGCHNSNLNGRYKADGAKGPDGLNWLQAHSDWRSFTFSEMKVQPV
ncbi:uncharacterized protein LOC112568964 isoform X1 [Pomacea canaliculata]|uniref:uncharacterized protein LOC112568964 isoform X1 n=1 Tax=Pomacea canaliculata TaxID=400727 RepID=UPI000D73D334|nr:uncharacterized protein LOC112568964 isoform X1 [Pomacea canaliculata]